jgi:hypothetical protein
MIRYLLVFLWCLAFSNVLQANPDSLIKVSINGFMNFLEHDQKNIDLGKHSQVIYSFDGLQNLDYRDSLYVNGGEYNRMFSSTETNYKDAWKLINNFNDDGDNTYIYVFHGKYFFNRKGLGEGFNDQEWDKYLNVSKLSKTTKQKKIFSSLIVDELYEKVKTKYPQKKIAIVYVFEEFTATKSSDKGNLYSTNNPIGSLNGKNLYYKDFRIFWNYINFNAFEKGIWMQEKYRQVSSIPFGQSGSASSEDYGKAFLQTVRNKIEASKEAKEALYPDLPPRERLYAHKLKQANFDPSKVSGFAELKPNGFMYNWNAAYNIISEKKRQNPNFDLSTINAILGSYYFDNSLVAGQTLNLSIKDITKFDPKTQSNQNMLMAHFFGRIKWANEIHYKKVFLQSLAYGLIVEISLPASSPLKARLKSQNDKLLDALESYEGGNPNFRTHFATLRQDVQKARMPALVTTTPTTTVSPWTVLLVPLKAIQDYYLPALFEEIDQSAILSACYPVYETLREASEIVDFDAINAVLGDDKESKLYEILKKLYKNQADDDLRDLANLENKIYTGQTLTDNEWERYKDLLCRIKGDCRELTILKETFSKFKSLFQSNNYNSLSDNNKVTAIENIIRNESLEYIIILHEGVTFLIKKGMENKVSFSEYDYKIPEGAILIHNHPTNGNFSEQDFICASGYKLSKMIAIGPNKRYTMEKPTTGWPTKSQMEVSAKNAREDWLKTYSEEYKIANEQRKKELTEIYWENARKDIVRDYNIIIVIN